jgi:hypothetical protein
MGALFHLCSLSVLKEAYSRVSLHTKASWQVCIVISMRWGINHVALWHCRQFSLAASAESKVWSESPAAPQYQELKANMNRLFRMLSFVSGVAALLALLVFLLLKRMPRVGVVKDGRL